jgi:hypothetical protein
VHGVLKKIVSLTFDNVERMSWLTTDALEFKSNPLEVT